jgi:hypothetical protein
MEDQVVLHHPLEEHGALTRVHCQAVLRPQTSLTKATLGRRETRRHTSQYPQDPDIMGDMEDHPLSIHLS